MLAGCKVLCTRATLQRHIIMATMANNAVYASMQAQKALANDVTAWSFCQVAVYAQSSQSDPQYHAAHASLYTQSLQSESWYHAAHAESIHTQRLQSDS